MTAFKGCRGSIRSDEGGRREKKMCGSSGRGEERPLEHGVVAATETMLFTRVVGSREVYGKSVTAGNSTGARTKESLVCAECTANPRRR
jgi:hypothetical protein